MVKNRVYIVISGPITDEFLSGLELALRGYNNVCFVYNNSDEVSQYENDVYDEDALAEFLKLVGDDENYKGLVVCLNQQHIPPDLVDLLENDFIVMDTTGAELDKKHNIWHYDHQTWQSEGHPDHESLFVNPVGTKKLGLDSNDLRTDWEKDLATYNDIRIVEPNYVIVTYQDLESLATVASMKSF